MSRADPTDTPTLPVPARATQPATGEPSGAAPLPSCIETSDPSQLDAILARAVNVAVWRRPLSPLLQAAVAAAFPRGGRSDGPAVGSYDEGPSFEGTIHRGGKKITDVLAPLGDAAARDAMVDEVVRMADILFRLVPDSSLHCHWAIVRTDKCRKFHADYVKLRLLVTYEGPGTLWVPEEGVSRAAMADRVPCPETDNARIVADPTRWVRQARVGDVVLLKGEAWPGNAGRGAVHRSPPLTSHSDGPEAARRVVLTLTAKPPA